MSAWANEVVLESHRVRRARLLAAFLRGPQADRSVTVSTTKRFAWSIVAAAAISVGCLGYSIVAPAIMTALGLK